MYIAEGCKPSSILGSETSAMSVTRTICWRRRALRARGSRRGRAARETCYKLCAVSASASWRLSHTARPRRDFIAAASLANRMPALSIALLGKSTPVGDPKFAQCGGWQTLSNSSAHPFRLCAVDLTMSLLSRSAASVSAASRSFISFYSTVSGLTLTNWRTGAHPAPQPATVSTESPDAAFDEDIEEKKPIIKRIPGQLPPTPPRAKAHREAMKKAYPNGWSPPRKLSRQAMDAMRSLHATDPESFTTPLLAAQFHVSPEAVRRILKSKWEPTKEERTRLADRERRFREDWVKQKKADEAGKLKALLATKERRERPERKGRKNDGLMFK